MSEPSFTPQSWGAGVATHEDLSYVDFVDDVEKYLGEIEDKIMEGVNWVWDQWDDCVLSKYGAVVGLGAWLLIKHARDNLEDAIEAIWEKFEEVCVSVWDDVKPLFATPWGLMDLSDRYSSAAGILRGEATTIDRVKRHIDKGWSGDAYKSYAGMTEEQKGALSGLAEGLRTASFACAASADQIWSTWIALLDYVIAQLNAVFAKIKDATDVGQWVTIEAGVVTSLIGQLTLNVASLLTKMTSFWADNQTVNFAVWNNLNNGSGLPGIVVTGEGEDREVQWPQLSPSDTEDVEDSGAWTHSA